MSDDMIALSRRVVACKGWRWMPGMLAYFEHDGRRVRVTDPACWVSTTALPDLTDPATLGCLLALVREAWGDERTAVKWWEPEGCAYYAHPLDTWRPPATLFASEAEALVAALEAAP